MLLRTEGGLQPGHHPQKTNRKKPLLRREVLCAIPPLPFPREDFLSGTDNGRVSKFRAGSGLLSQSKIAGYLGLFPNDSRARYGGFPRFEIRA